MNLELRTRGVRLSKSLRRHIEDRLYYALHRFGDRIARVHVEIADLNGPRGGEDTRCRIRVRLQPSGELVVDEVRTDPFRAMASAARRIGYRVSRRLDRRRSRRTAA